MNLAKSGRGSCIESVTLGWSLSTIPQIAGSQELLRALSDTCCFTFFI